MTNIILFVAFKDVAKLVKIYVTCNAFFKNISLFCKIYHKFAKYHLVCQVEITSFHPFPVRRPLALQPCPQACQR